MKKYTLTQQNKTRYICLVILNEMIQFQHYFPVKLEGEDVFLEQYLEKLNQLGLVRIEKNKYVPTDKGRDEIVNLYAKYEEYLKMFDIFCAVDLEKGEFAFSRIGEDMPTEDWYNFLNEERFSDVRVAVADFKGLDPIEIVFMSFLNENRLDCSPETPHWQNILTADAVWNEIEEICNTAISREYLEPDGVLEDVIKQGTEIALELIRQAEESINAEEEQEEEEIVEETVVETYVETVEQPYYPYSYWEPYYDPFYISPIWVAAAIVLW